VTSIQDGSRETLQPLSLLAVMYSTVLRRLKLEICHFAQMHGCTSIRMISLLLAGEETFRKQTSRRLLQIAAGRHKGQSFRVLHGGRWSINKCQFKGRYDQERRPFLKVPFASCSSQYTRLLLHQLSWHPFLERLQLLIMVWLFKSNCLLQLKELVRLNGHPVRRVLFVFSFL
jgi:hypothetical protein